MTAARRAILDALRAGRGDQGSVGVVLDEAQLFADVARDDDLVARFRARLLALSGELCEVRDVASAALRLLGVLAEGGGSVAAQSFPLLERMCAASSELAEALASAWSPAVAPSELARVAIGITRAEALVARTGSVFLTSKSSGGRLLSVLPPTHVVLATRSQLVPSLGDALARLQADSETSFATFAGGPSRTADIEKILVLGAHGPKRLVVILVDD